MLKLLLGFEDISYYLQYNARCEFFTNSMFKPNPDCRDNKCVERQLTCAKSGSSFIQSRKNLIEKQKEKAKPSNHFSEENKVDAKEWGIELINETPTNKKEEFISKEEKNEFSLEELMGKMKDMSFGKSLEKN